MESKGFGAKAAVNDLIETKESSSADEEDVLGIDLDVFLLRMLASTLRWNTAGRPLQDLEKGLLDPFSGNIPGDRGAVRLTADLVNLIDINNADLGLLHIVVRILKKPQHNVLHILPHITRLGQGRCVGDAERNVKDPCQGPR